MDYRQALIAKLRQQDCFLNEALSTDASLCFTYQKTNYTFFLPSPPEEWSNEVWIEIQDAIEFLGLELLPLDFNVRLN
ncbi:MAG: hypothetical protein ACR2OT_07465 [Parvibaculales bacterium]